MISCYVIGEISTVEALCDYINSFPLTSLEGFAFQHPENFNAVYSLKPDIVFIDSTILNKHGLWLNRIKEFSSVIIVAENRDIAFEAFEHQAFDYLVKPLPFDRFVQSINKFNHLSQLVYAARMLKTHTINDSFFIKADSKGHREILIKCVDLFFIEALQNYVILHVNDGQKFICYNTMKEMEESLSIADFSRVHKSFIINDSKVNSVEGNMIFLDDKGNTKIQMGNTYKKSFLDKKNLKMIKKQKSIHIIKSSNLGITLILCGMVILEYISINIDEAFSCQIF